MFFIKESRHTLISIGNHQKIHLFKIIEILNKFKIFKYHLIGKFSNIIDLRKLDFLSEEIIGHDATSKYGLHLQACHNRTQR